LPATFATAAALAAAMAMTGASAQEVTDPALASVDWPPAGERLRDLAERLDIEIGFAARRDWPDLPEADIYRDIVTAEFGLLTPEASLKWNFVHPFEGRYDFDDENDVDDLLDFAEANGMRVYALPLTWYFLNPAWLEALPADRMEPVLRDHVDTVVSRYAGRVDVWGVVNEGLDDEGTGFREEDPFYAALGPRYMDVAFGAARDADPAARLIYNDFNIGWLTPKSARALELVDELQARGVPLDGIGMQMHIDHTFVQFEGFSEAMQRFVDRDLDVHVTELDVGVLRPSDYAVQAEVYEQVIRRCLMQPRCEAVQIWGVDDFYSWRPFFDPLPFDDDFRVKPAYFGMQRGLMTQPVHPESCTLQGARIARGTVYSASGGGAAPADVAGESFTIACPAVPLGGGFTSLEVRYRNPGTDVPELAISAGDVPLATLALTPTPMTSDGDYRTVRVTVPPLATTRSLTLTVGAVSDGAEVGIDALLFGDPTRALVTDGSGDSSRGGGGASGPLWLIAPGTVLGLRRRRQARQAMAVVLPRS